MLNTKSEYEWILESGKYPINHNINKDDVKRLRKELSNHNWGGPIDPSIYEIIRNAKRGGDTHAISTTEALIKLKEDYERWISLHE